MRVQLQVSGGIGFFPGLAAAKAIDVDALAEPDRRMVRELVDEAAFFTLPRRINPPRGAADYKIYEITVEDGARRHRVAVSDPVASPALQKLIEKLQSIAAP
jgi:hypothetical protein